jgi:hypothetical protein
MNGIFPPPGAFLSNFVTHPSFFGKGGSRSVAPSKGSSFRWGGVGRRASFSGGLSPGGGGTVGNGELNIDFFFGNIKLDSSGAVGLKISDVPNGTLETKTSFPNNDLNGVLGTKTCN